MLLLSALCVACPRPTKPAVSVGPKRAELCAMAAATLRETIKPNAAQPFGLEEACVRRLASIEGRIYVDARIEGQDRLSGGAATCLQAPYEIRFDAEHFSPSPAQGVVLLMVSADQGGARKFNAIVEEPNWPARRPEVLAVSPCGSAFGVIRPSGPGWTVAVVPPPRSADAL